MNPASDRVFEARILVQTLALALPSKSSKTLVFESRCAGEKYIIALSVQPGHEGNRGGLAYSSEMAGRENMARNNELATAYHEAGHAVVAFYLCIAFKYVTIIPGKGCFGHLKPKPLFRSSENPGVICRLFHDNKYDRVRRKAEKNATVLMAGMEAQRRFRPSSVRSYHGTKDDTDVLDYLEYFAADKELWFWQKQLRAQAKNLIASHWPAVEAVAAALLERKRLTGDEVRAVIDAASQPWHPQKRDK